MTPPKKPKRVLNVHIPEGDWLFLHRLAVRRELSLTMVVRGLIADERTRCAFRRVEQANERDR